MLLNKPARSWRHWSLQFLLAHPHGLPIQPALTMRSTQTLCTRTRSGISFRTMNFMTMDCARRLSLSATRPQSGALIAHETPGVTHYYLEQFRRTDLNSKAISAPDFDVTKTSGSAYFIVQRGRTYFENRDKLAFIRANFKKVDEVSINGMSAAEVLVNQGKKCPTVQSTTPLS